MILLFILLCYGLTNIVVNESIFKGPVYYLRNKHKIIDNLLGCSTCLGFWVGLLMAIFVPVPILVGSGLFNLILYGIISSGAINIIEHIKIRIGY